jgi:molybdopterin/thiamine biosynthesis adenylyltransferase
MKTMEFYKEMVDRNIGVLSDKEQEKLRNSCVAVAGCGGMGGLSAEQLVRLGVGHVKIADFDNFAVHNLSRQTGSATSNVGRNKAEVLGAHFKDINPELRLDIFSEGVTVNNAEKFTENAAAVIDGTDYSRLESTVGMYASARKRGICVINPNAIGFGVNVFVFGPKTVSFDEYLGLSSGINPRMALAKLVPYMPKYGDKSIIQKVLLEGAVLPNIAMPQYLGTAVAVSEAVMIMLGRVEPPKGPDPRIFVIDLQERKFEVKG